MFLSSYWPIIQPGGTLIYISLLSFFICEVQKFSLSSREGFFFLDAKCHPSVDIPPNTHVSACNLHHLQCSWVWPLGAEAEHKYTELKMADWWMAPVLHSRLTKLNLNFLVFPVSHLVPSLLESAHCRKNQHLRVQKERQKHKCMRGQLWFSAAGKVQKQRHVLCLC